MIYLLDVLIQFLRCARAEREEAASAIAPARVAGATAADDDDDALDSVDADEDADFEAFLEDLYSPSD